MKRTENREKTAAPVAGLTGWLLERWKGVQRSKPKLALLERNHAGAEAIAGPGGSGGDGGF